MPPADNRAHLAAAAARRSADTRQRATDALCRLDAAGTPVSFAAVAAAAGVSRSWLYRDSGIRSEIARLRATAPASTGPAVPAARRASELSLRQRLDALLDDNRALREENRSLHEHIAVLFGEQRAENASPRTAARLIGPCS
jgi:hypothetical protein